MHQWLIFSTANFTLKREVAISFSELAGIKINETGLICIPVRVRVVGAGCHTNINLKASYTLIITERLQNLTKIIIVRLVLHR